MNKLIKKGLAAVTGVGLLLLSLTAAATSSINYPASPNCRVVSGGTTGTVVVDSSGFGNVWSVSQSGNVQLSCNLNMDSQYSYQQVTAHFQTAGSTSGITNGSIGSTTCSASVCMAVCQIVTGNITNCGTMASISGGNNFSTAMTVNTGWTAGAANVLIVNLGPQQISDYTNGLWQYSVFHF